MWLLPEWAPNFHPLIVHFPIALLFLAGLVDLVGLVLRDKPFFTTSAASLYVLGGFAALAAALGITVYWPIVSLAALVDARNASGWEIASEGPYWIVCLLVASWGVLGLCLLIRKPEGEES